MALALAGVGLMTSPAPADAATVLAAAEWNAPFGGRSRCQPVTPTSTTVVCSHNYTSISEAPGGVDPMQTCATGGVLVDVGPIRTDSCHATVSGTTAGPGKNVNTDAAVCDTRNLDSGLKFTITGPFGPYEMEFDLADNNEVVTFISAEEIVVDDLQPVVQKMAGYFMGGCGLPTGQRAAFVGTWTLTRG